MEAFHQTLNTHIQTLNAKYQEKYLIEQEMYGDIALVLRDGWGDLQFKFWTRKHFQLMKIGNVNGVYNKGKDSRPVVVYEELCTKLTECHLRVGHHGRDKTWNEVNTSCGVLSPRYSCQSRLSRNIRGYRMML
jgi:hypothetical protein